ncbi:hypothetical protein MALU111345_13575 [Marinicrinis lubricantis]
MEAGETLEKAMIREAKEETGLDVRVHGIVSVNEAFLERSKEHALFMTFRAEIVGGEEKIFRPDEIGEIRWVDLQQADQWMPYYKEGISGIVRSKMEIIYFDEGTV